MATLSAELEQELEHELEHEHEHEHEHEFEGELEHEHEHELEGEFEGEFELEHEQEQEHEQEGEHEAFFNSLAAMGDRQGRAQALRRVALAAAHAALQAAGPRRSPAVEGEMEFEHEASLAPELELEFDSVRRAQLPGSMSHLGHAAAEAANEQEAAEHFLPLIGLAAKFVLPKIAGAIARRVGGRLISRVGGQLVRRVGGRLVRNVGNRLVRRFSRNMPQLNRAVANVTRTLWRNRSTRPLVNAIPQLTQRTVWQLGRRLATGRPVSSRDAVRIFANNTARLLGRPAWLRRTYRHSRWLDRRYHRLNRRVLGRPYTGPGSRTGWAGPAGTSGPVGGWAPPIASAIPSVAVPGWASGTGPAPATVGGCQCRCNGTSVPVTTAPAGVGCPTCGRP